MSLRCTAGLDSPASLLNTLPQIYEKGSIWSFFFFFCSTKPVVLAQMATPCGHSFCGFCVDELGKTVRPISCPMCRQRVDRFCKNIFACKALSTFQGECLGCNATFTLDMAKDHVNNCPQMEMICSHCKEKVKRGDTSLHSDQCVMKQVNCVCGMKVKRKDMDAHKEESCSWKKISCPLNCKDMIERFVLFLSFLRCLPTIKKEIQTP